MRERGINMKRIRHSIVSVLLIFALVIPLGAPALAAVDPSAVVLTATNDTLYIISGRSSTTQITANAAPSGFDGTIQWTVVSGNANLLENNPKMDTVLDYASNRSLSVAASGLSTGRVRIQATLSSLTSNKRESETIDIYIVDDSVKKLESSLGSNSISAGQNTYLLIVAELASGRTVQDSDLIYTSSDPTVARVDASGVITGISAGITRITARLGGRETSQTITVTSSSSSPLPVVNPTDITDTAPLGAKYSMRNVYSKLLALYAATYSAAGSVETPSDSASVRLIIPQSSEAYGDLIDSAGREVFSGDYVSFRLLEEMQLEPRAEGLYTFNASLFDGSRMVSADYTILIEAAVHHIRVAVGGSDNYSFSDLDQNGKTGVKLIQDAVGTSFGSIRFGAVQSGEEVGTLYTSSDMSSSNRVGSRTVVAAENIGNLFFSPSRSGTFRILYDAYAGRDGRGVALCSGELIVAVDAASLNVVVNLSNTDPYLFSDLPATGSDSASTLLINAINEAVGRYSWSVIRFDTASASSAAVGALHENAFVRQEIASTDAIQYTDVRNLYFVPVRTGAFEIYYNVYSDSTSKVSLANGKLRIVISNVPTSSADIVYTITAGQTLGLNEDDFIHFYQNKEGSRYSLGYVVFNDYTGEGSFMHDTTAFTPYNSADYYTRDYTGTRSNSPRYLDSVKFTAPKTAGYTAVKFTCYGGTSTDRNNVKDSGVLYIFYTSEELPAITYEAYGSTSPSFSEKDFIPIYQKATNTTASAPQFSIRLLTAPSYGTLYRNYNSNSSSTRLTQSNIVEYTFTVNGSNSRNSVDTLSYTSFNNTSVSSDSVVYIVYDKDGAQLYSGVVRFKLQPDRTLQSASEGYTFSLTDFIVNNDRDPVRTIVFHKPESGKLYVLQDGKIIAPPESTRYYTLNPTEGTYPIGSLRYVPKYGQTGTVSLSYVTYTATGGSSETTIKVNITDKQTSSKFTDVSGWATNSIDFAQSMGLVGGMADNPPRFFPSSTMRRQDLLLILYRLAGQPAVSGTTPYTDVPTNAYYYTSSIWAYQNNIMNGAIVGNLYNPGGDVTRQDFAQILYNYTRATGGNTASNATLSRYSDANNVSSLTLEGVTWAVSQGYITSTTAGYTLEPLRTATRAEIVTFLHRYLTY